MNNSINEKLKSLVKKAANIDSSINISINENLNNLGIDSLSFISLIVDIEYEFNIVFDDDMLLLEKFRSINDLANYIKILIK
ncbi:MAG: acyl carrier protein [Clostridium sp.]|nr:MULTISPECIES: acyl carrier protein [Clostridium]MDU4144979.1 acyl carrier protein [Clostridium sp.]